MNKPAKLARHIGLPLVTLYGLGTILGAGIYVLVGKVAGAAGMLAPLSFLVAAVIAAFTALSYAQLVVLYPKSSGEVVYIDKSFHFNRLSILVGGLIIITGIVSASTLANGFVGYLNIFIKIPPWLAISILVLVFGALACWGIKESMWVSALMTCFEIIGLLIVLWLRGDVLQNTSHNLPQLFVPVSMIEVSGIVSGAFIAFYAFIGFEDMVNVVEEVKNPIRTMPRAIFAALIVATSLYFLVALIAVQAIPLADLAASDAPLALLVDPQLSSLESGQNSQPDFARLVALISLFAIVNGVLVQIIMASRVLYGMACQAKAPAIFSTINPHSSTPIIATCCVVVLVWVASLWLPLLVLAKITSFVVLVVFTLVNLALWNLKRTVVIPCELKIPNYPLVGALLCLTLLSLQVYISSVGSLGL